MLQANKSIADLQTQHIDIFTCNLLMDKCKSPEQEYTEAKKFIKTVRTDLIKVDIAKELAKRWKQEITDVRHYLLVTIDSDEELLRKFNNIDSCVDAYLEMLKHPGYTLGFPAIDYSFGKLRKKKVFLIGAYSKVGKTDFLIEILLHSILRLKLRCLVVSMEMEKESFIQRLMCKLFGIRMDKLEEIMLSPEGLEKIQQLREKLDEYLYIIDENDLTLKDIKDYVLLANEKVFDKPVDRVFVDYFQYLKNTSEYAGISETAKAMKPFAKSLNVQLFMLSQFNRQGNPWDEPSILSFRGGNDMESSFDYAMLLWRPSTKPGLADIELNNLKYLTRIKIISRDNLNGSELFDMYYNPKTTNLQPEKITGDFRF